MKDYSSLKEIIVKSQEELDEIPCDFKGAIYIDFGTWNRKAIVSKKYLHSVVARENSSVEARENSSVEARENSSVEAWENSSVVAWGNSSVEARENSSVEARENSSVVARGNSSVVAWENSSVEAWENSSVEAWENSSVVARGNSSVVAWGNSSVEARGNSSVVARENSSVVANANVQVVDCLQCAKIKISGNARIVYMPKSIHEFMNLYGIKHTKTSAIFYKAVHKADGIYFADYDSEFEYSIGEIAKVDDIDTDVENECGIGIHISTQNFALSFGRGWSDLAIIEVEAKISEIIMPKNAGEKVRTRKVKVLREVPLEECGVFGKILAKRIAQCSTK